LSPDPDIIPQPGKAEAYAIVERTCIPGDSGIHTFRIGLYSNLRAATQSINVVIASCQARLRRSPSSATTTMINNVPRPTNKRRGTDPDRHGESAARQNMIG
jgi:hypothetical protein